MGDPFIASSTMVKRVVRTVALSSIGSTLLVCLSCLQTVAYYSSLSLSLISTKRRSLNDVAAVSTSDIWAVGNFSRSNSTSSTLIEHWNGSKWSIISSPNPGSISNGLGGIGAVSAGDIWAVGGFSNTTKSSQTLIIHWNGTHWSVI